jgi:hypothetical protein
MIKFTEEELATVRTLNEKTRAVTLELGEIELAKLQLQKRRKFAEEYLANLRAEQETNGKALTEKYGNGNIDLQTGEFTPIEE